MTLLEMERRMATAVMRPLTLRYGMRKRTPEGKFMPAEAAEFIKPNKFLSSFERLELYNRQYWFRVLSALTEDFPGLEAIVGKKRFEPLIRAYLEAHPSRSFTLRNLGSELEAWLRANPQWTGARHAVAIDVVRLEWAYIEAFDNGQEPALSQEDAAQIDGGSCLSLQPHVRLLELDFAIDDFIIDVHRRQISSDVASNAVTGMGRQARRKQLDRFPPGKTFLAVHRFDFSVYYKRLEREAYLLLESLESGTSLSGALEKAFQNSDVSPSDQASRIQQWFSSWAELGWFCRHRKPKAQPRRRGEKR